MYRPCSSYAGFLAIAGLMLVYTLMGYAIGMPYTWLAAGTVDHLPMTALVAPLICFVLFVLWMIGFRRLVWSLGLYWCIPILLNGVSLLLHRLGYEAPAQYLFSWRYMALWFPVWGLVIVLIGLSIKDMICSWLSQRPPSKPSTPQQQKLGKQGSISADTDLDFLRIVLTSHWA